MMFLPFRVSNNQEKHLGPIPGDGFPQVGGKSPLMTANLLEYWLFSWMISRGSLFQAGLLNSQNMAFGVNVSRLKEWINGQLSDAVLPDPKLL
jgi:hypothetical protein